MSEKQITWYNRLNGGLWQSEVEHGAVQEKRESFEKGENFDTTFGYATKRCGYTRQNAAMPGSACIKSRYPKRGRSHVQFGDKKLGGTPEEFLMGVSFKVPDNFQLEVNMCAPLLFRRGVDYNDKGIIRRHEFMLYLINLAGVPNLRLEVMTRDPVGDAWSNEVATVNLDVDTFTSGAWHRADFQYWTFGAKGHICLIYDGNAADQAQVDFSAAHYWLDPGGDAAGGKKNRHAGQVYIGGFPGQDWSPYLPVTGMIYDVLFAEFRYDEEAYFDDALSELYEHIHAYAGNWILDRDIDADIVTRLDEGGGMLLAGSGTTWDLPGAITNSQPSWQPSGGVTLLGGTWQENPGLVILETGDGKTPLSSIFGPDSSQLVPTWTMFFRLDQPPYLGQDDEWAHLAGTPEFTFIVIASQGFIDLVTPANDQSPSGWVLGWYKSAAGWDLRLYVHVAKATTNRAVVIADTTATAGEIWITIRRTATELTVDSTYGAATAAYATNLSTQLDGTEPLVIGAQFATLEDRKNLRSAYPQAMFTIKEFRALPYALNDERVESTEWRTEYQDPHSDYLALFRFQEGQGNDLVDFSLSRLRGTIIESGVNETYVVSAYVPGAPGTPGLWGIRRYGDMLPQTWTHGHPTAGVSPIDAVTIYHHPQLGETTVALGDGHAWNLTGTTLTDIAADYGSTEVPKVGTLDYAQYVGRVYVADGSNRPQVLEAGRFRPAGLEAPPLHAKPGVLAYPGSDVTGYVTYLVCYENIEAGVVSDGVVTDPVYLDGSGALIGWDAEAAGIQGIPCSECEGALTRGGPAIITWFSGAAGATDFTWEGMVKIEEVHTGADSAIWTKADNGTPQDILIAKISHNGAQTQLKFFWRDAALPAVPIVHGSIDVPSVGVYHHYAWVYDGSNGTHRFYLDGRLFQEKPLSAAAPAIVGNAAGSLTFHDVVAAIDGRFELAEWRFWNRCRTEAEISNQFFVSLKSSADADLIFNISPKSTSLYIDEVYRHAAGTGTDRALDNGIISWLKAPDYSLFQESRDKYAPLPLCKDLATHIQFYRSSPYALGATPTPAEVAEAKQSAEAGPWRFVGRAQIGDTYWVDRTYQDAERDQRSLAEVEPPPRGAYYIERFGAMMVYARTDRYPERLWVSKVWEPETIQTNAGWVDIDDGTGEPITGLCAIGERLYVFKPSSIHAVIGTEPSLLQMTLVSRGTGTLSNRSLLQAMGRLWLWTPNGPGVMESGQVVSLAMPITDEVRHVTSHDDVIGLFDPLRHRVGWLVQQDFDTTHEGNENSAILWFDYLYQIWSKHTWKHGFFATPASAVATPINVVGADTVFDESTAMHLVYTVDDKGWIYKLDPTTEIDGARIHTTTPASVVDIPVGSTATITGIVGMTANSLVGLPVLVVQDAEYAGGVPISVHPFEYYTWQVVKSNTTTTITLDDPALHGQAHWYLGGIDMFLQKAWSDGGAPTRGKIFQKFFWRPTTYDQDWWVYLYVQRALADYDEGTVNRYERVTGDGRFQVDLHEQGTRLKWILTSPVPGAAGLQEAGWTGRIMPGEALPYLYGAGQSQLYTLYVWPGSGAPGFPGYLPPITAADDGAVPTAGEA